MIHIGRCFNASKPCSGHLGKFTDVNIWNRVLTSEEMKGWTNCR